MGVHVHASAGSGPCADGAAHEDGDHGQPRVIQLDLRKQGNAGGDLAW